ncbi:splicing factor ESS-2 homolog [Ptychodera flava]|uniref:splicing factor ESS-2 homolog n=1 Tax=Ptychodera flava TaxID=63121 RepID=UPI00396A54BE
MALVKIDDSEKALVIHGGVSKTKKGPKKNVLPEEKYTEDMEKIIERDFFPDMEKLRAQKEYMEALENNDIERMRELAMQLSSARSRRPDTDARSVSAFVEASPATFETPEVNFEERFSPKRTRENDIIEEEEAVTEEPPVKMKKKDDSDLSLDAYLSKNTSEDNASFSQIMRVAEEKEREKHAWIYSAEKEHAEQQQKMLEGTDLKAIKGVNKPVETWTYQAKNMLMYVPEGVEDSVEEKIQKKKPREIVHENTRFGVNPFNLTQQKDTLARAAAAKAAIWRGKIGPDGKEIMAEETPNVNGYSFVATPSPAPGRNGDESPMMTWGEIESTPFRLDGSQTPAPGPSFRIPDVPRREKIGMRLAEKVSQTQRSKKQEALRRMTEGLASSSPAFKRMGSVDRMKMLSPAAQKLVNKSLGKRASGDKALRASYTPSPCRTPDIDRTPVRLTPSRTPQKSVSSLSTNLGDIQSSSSSTDNHSDSQKRTNRSRAMDFF